ncbi:BspA family leucine-rich repeat surface protein [Vagococcus zengguangii]|uniref:BspA family leucine-rich repeat surface protein n=1 Tax=Vagococcus zengguangii TaxID=2571750 RepID=UPI001109DCCE|nr:BspA family leucine-rich repeat surface protein [Vagococcus zengguangii]TLG78424.1 BspA family leucine-rich repeat surface protein [Vagococcus zengguangii]
MTNKKFNKTLTFVSVTTIALGSLGLYSSSVLRNATPLKADEINTEVLEETLPTSEIAQGMVDGSLVSETSESAVMSESEDTSEEVIESTEEVAASESTTEVESVVDTESTKENSVKKETFETRAEPTYTIDGSTLTIHAGEVNQEDFFGRKGVQKELITKVVIDGPITGTTHSKFLKEFTNVEEIIGLENIDLTNSVSIDGFFYGCEKIKEVDISAWKTDNIGSISTLFYNCYSIESIDLSTFNTSNVWDMGDVFFNCKNLTNLNINNWDTSNVIQMWRMFRGCEKLETINIAHFDTSSVTNMNSMFYNCLSLTNLDVSHFKTDNVTNMSSMFRNCESLEVIGVSNWNVSNVTAFNYTFADCPSLTTLDVSNWVTSSATDMQYMFNHCEVLKVIDVSSFVTDNVTNIQSMFDRCLVVEELEVSNWNTSNVTTMEKTFNEANELVKLDVSNWQTDNVTTFAFTFSECYKLNELNVSNWNVANADSFEFMFNKCYSLQSLDTSSWQTPKATKMQWMFAECKAIQSLDVSSFDTSNVLYMSSMFSGMETLESLILGGFDTSSCLSMRYMFAGQYLRDEIDVSSFDTSKVVDMSAMFYNNRSMTSIDLSNFDISSVRGIYNYGNLEFPDGGLNHLFKNCYSLESIDISSFDLTNVEMAKDMFDVRGFATAEDGQEPGDLVLSHIVLGPNFSLDSHTDTKFDTLVPPTEVAKWSRKGEDGKFNLVPLTAEELATTYDGSTMAGDWYWVESLGLKVKDHEMMVGDEWIAERDHFVSVTDEFGNPSTWEEQNVQVVNLSDIKTNLADTYQVEFKSDAFEEVAKLLVNAGELTIVESPSTLYFGDHKISNTSQTYDVEQLDKPLKITDLRGIENAGWSLTAKMLVELTNEEQLSVLDKSITYTDEVRDQVITANDSALIYSTLTEGTDEIAIPLEEYLKLEVPTGKARQGAYTGTIVWELNNAPANEIN